MSRRRFANEILASLPDDEASRLEPYLHPVTFTRSGLWLSQNRRPTTVLFPDAGVLSATIRLPSSATLEVSMIGFEGVVGCQLAFDQRGLPWDVHVQVPGSGHALPTDIFASELNRREALWTQVTRFGREEVRQLALLAVCNHFHTVQQRCARWLLMAADRLGSPDVPVTHDVLAAALGGRRPSVSLAIETLQSEGAITRKRRVVRIVDHRALQQHCCGCYALLKL